ncbi:hypothetical protein H5410_035381 [Solanum commersonii]|uniref:Uncharacterized protein n=1 Tax=Solanum commersonii TaxID=4109 RepID=A0A9J5Y1R4_SOLCO|nr:hypothetical protein H5410_035381 [Solanum commersonii]
MITTKINAKNKIKYLARIQKKKKSTLLANDKKVSGKAARTKDGAEALGAGGELTGESLDGTVGLDGVDVVEGVGAVASVPVQVPLPERSTRMGLEPSPGWWWVEWRGMAEERERWSRRR